LKILTQVEGVDGQLIFLFLIPSGIESQKTILL